MEQPHVGVPDGAQLLDRIVTFIGRFVVLPEGVASLLAAWVVHTYAFAAADYTPYVVVVSATKGCGKSRLLETVELLVERPLASANITPAALYRSIEEGKEPTMLLDEQDGLRDGSLREVLNAGFRRGQMVLRTREKLDGVDSFPAFCPKVFASIGGISPTVADRSIRINMTRRLPTESVEAFRRRDVEPDACRIRDDARVFAVLHAVELSQARPAFPEGLDDRGRDIYEPLLAISDLAGGSWGLRLREDVVANRLIRFGQDDDLHTELLGDIRTILMSNGITEGFIKTHGLLEHLTEDESMQWGEYDRGRGPSPKKLAMWLGDFGISSRRKQVNGEQRNGYFAEDFREPFLRYLAAPDAGVDEAAPASTEDGGLDDVLPEKPSKAWYEQTRTQREQGKELMG